VQAKASTRKTRKAFSKPPAAATVYIGLGANVGDRPGNLAAAWERVCRLLADTRLSRMYRTEPQHLADQPEYLNAVGSGETTLDPLDLLDALNAIEEDLGRNRAREVRMGPRPIDLDILLYGDLVMESSRLCIPHPRMAERRFVLVPLLELAPGLRDPRTGRRWAEMLPLVAGQGVVLHSGR
jgi:2-amino-4-hydroxy-6-hydroxymethyldihydropteridine diphosphokinase